MKKEDIIEKLKQLSFDKKQYVVIGGAALVLHDVIEDTDDIDLACSSSYYGQLDWEEKQGFFHTNIKCFSCFEIGTSFYDMERTEVIFDFLVANLEACYDLKILENKKKDKKVIQKLDLLLCMQDSYRYERRLKKQGVKYIAGVDEVGRGPLIGPVVAASVILPDDFSLEGLTDSKKLTEKKRDYFYEEIQKQALAIGVGIISAEKIDEVNIYEATKLAMTEAISKLSIRPDHILIDAMPLELDIPTTSIIKGDMKSITISAASVIAKVTRDRMLYELDEVYPMYGFKSHKGYPTKKHLEAIENYGILKEHRRSYGPVRDYLQKNE